MDDRRLELGPVDSVRAESFGEPGQRTFRLLAERGDGRISLWLEKEQIAMLGSALEDLLARAGAVAVGGNASRFKSDFVGDLEVRVGSLALGFDVEAGGFSLEASDFTSPFDLSSITFLAQREQLETVRDQIQDIVSQSRPRCILCGRPLTDEPHFCPESNGHAELAHSE